MACSANYTKTTPIQLVLLVLIIASSSVPLSTYCSTTSIVNNNKTAADDKFEEGEPKPTPWPTQFHSRMVMHTNTSYEVTDLWYDWPKGRNINYIQYQLGSLLYNQEWTNGTSFLYTIDQDPPAPLDQPCTVFQFDVGILRPNFMEGATYLGQREADGFLCNVWEKVDYFITYYEDVVSKRPVYWILYTGKKTHVMTWEVGAVLEDAECQTPAFCFDQNGNAKSPSLGAPPNFDFERISPLPIRRSSSYM